MRKRTTWESSDVAWRGGTRPYDLIREVLISGLAVAVVVVGLSLLFASPDPPPVTFRQWAQQGPTDFLGTTLAELDGTSLSATYGPPYQGTSQNGSTQGFGPLSPEKWFGQTIPVSAFQDYVVRPLHTLPGPNRLVDAALRRWAAASSAQQTRWSDAYTRALSHASFARGYRVPPGPYGPLGVIMPAQYLLARSGGLDHALVANPQDASTWYSNDQTFALLYMGDSGQGGTAPSCINAGQPLPPGGGCWYYNQAVANAAPRYAGYLAGSRWGVINEVGNWPGAWWLFPYSFWYQWGPGLTSASADLWAMIMTGLLTLVVLLLPWIPGLREIPRLTRVYRVMWGDYYRLAARLQPVRPRRPRARPETSR